MKQGILIALVVVLAVGLGIETGYLIKMNQDAAKKAAPPEITGRSAAFSSVDAPPAVRQAPLSRPPAFWGEEDERWDPFREIEEMQRLMNRMFRESYARGLTTHGSAGGIMPSGGVMSYHPDIDMNEKADAYVIKVDLPGIDKNNITVKAEGGRIIISGERKTEREEEAPAGGLYRSERSFGSFMRAMPIPADADTGKMTAEMGNGVLTITMPRRSGEAAEAATRVPVQ